MLIKDLEMTKELSGAELSAVRGGGNFAAQIGSTQAVGGAGSILFASPVVQANPQTITQNDNDTNVDVATITNVGGILASLLAQ
jgi:hypothetical protein